MEEVPVRILPDRASLYQQVEHQVHWINSNGLMSKSCVACKVRAALLLMNREPDQGAIDKICTCKKKKVGNGAPSGAFAFTLTKSDKDPLTVGDMLAAVRKVMSQKSCPVVKYAWYYEEKGRDDNGDPIHPHIHGMYETDSGGVIEKKHWVRAWNIWDPSKPMGAGFRGGYHRPVRSDEGYANYIKKDGGMSESYGLEQTE